MNFIGRLVTRGGKGNKVDLILGEEVKRGILTKIKP